MTLSRTTMLAVAAAMSLGCATGGVPKVSTLSPQAAVDELLTTDRLFSAASAKTDLVAGLSAMFAPDVMMPLPSGRFAMTATEAAEALRANPDNAGARVEWTPIRGGISADGEHGFTFGYMTLHRADSTRTPLKYLSYWIKRPEGWRVVAYRRGRSPAGSVALDLLSPSLPARLVTPTRDSSVIRRFMKSLADAESHFSDRAQVIGLGAAFAEQGSTDAVNMGGPGSAQFVMGAEAIGRVIGEGTPTTSSPVTWSADRTMVASSGDLGITFGLIRPNAPQAGAPATGFPFFTIWRRSNPNEPWRYIAE